MASSERLSALFIGGLPTDTSSADVRRLLGQHISATDIYLPKNLRTGKPRGFAFLNVPNSEVSLVLGRVYPYKGRMLRFELKSKKISGIKQTRRVFISNVPNEITDEELRAVFAFFGKVKYGYIIRSEGNGHFGFIEFENEKGVQNALQNYGRHFLFERWVKVEHFNKDKVKGLEQPIERFRCNQYQSFIEEEFSNEAYDGNYNNLITERNCWDRDLDCEDYYEYSNINREFNDQSYKIYSCHISGEDWSNSYLSHHQEKIDYYGHSVQNYEEHEPFEYINNKKDYNCELQHFQLNNNHQVLSDNSNPCERLSGANNNNPSYKCYVDPSSDENNLTKVVTHISRTYQLDDSQNNYRLNKQNITQEISKAVRLHEDGYYEF